MKMGKSLRLTKFTHLTLFFCTILMVGISSCEDNSIGSGIGDFIGQPPPNITDELNELLRPPGYGEPCLPSHIPTRINTGDTIPRPSGCIEFDKDFYKQPDSGKIVASNLRVSRNTKADFIRIYAPLAVYMQQQSGWPASALLAQWADETGWGRSTQVRVNNNIAGHSCFGPMAGRTRISYPVDSPSPQYITPKIKVDCTYKRPEGARYHTFDSMLDSAKAHVYNVLDNPRTNRWYSQARAEVNRALLAEEKPDPKKVVLGLNGYAAAGTSYINRVIGHIEYNDFEAYDDLTICEKDEVNDDPIEDTISYNK